MALRFRWLRTAKSIGYDEERGRISTIELPGVDHYAFWSRWGSVTVRKAWTRRTLRNAEEPALGG